MISLGTFSEYHVSFLRVSALLLYDLSSEYVLEIVKYIKEMQMSALGQLLGKSQ